MAMSRDIANMGWRCRAMSLSDMAPAQNHVARCRGRHENLALVMSPRLRSMSRDVAGDMKPWLWRCRHGSDPCRAMSLATCKSGATHCATSRHVAPHRAMSRHVAQCRTMSRHVAPCRATSCHIVPCRTMCCRRPPCREMLIIDRGDIAGDVRPCRWRCRSR